MSLVSSSLWSLQGKVDKTVAVTGVREPLTLEFLELWMESEDNGGGHVADVDVEEVTGCVYVVFRSRQHVENMLRMKSAEIHNIRVMFSEPIDDDGDTKSLVVSGFGKIPSKDMLKLYFGNKRKSGGGKVQGVTIFEDQNEAIVTFHERGAVDQVLLRSGLKLGGIPLTVVKQRGFRWDGKSVEVHVTGTHPLDNILKILFQHERRSGGGPISQIVTVDDFYVIRFLSSSVAERVLERGTVVLDETTFTMKKPTKEHLVTEARVEGRRSLSPRRAEPEVEELPTEVTVIGVPPGVDEEVLEMLFENKAKSGGGPVKSVKLDGSSGVAVVSFEQHADAKRVADNKVLEYGGIPLRIQLQTTIQASVKKSSSSGATRSDGKVEFDLQVTGIPEQTPNEFVWLFFEANNKSGGDPVNDAKIDSAIGTAVISFKDEGVAERVFRKYQKEGLVLNKAPIAVELIDRKLGSLLLKGSSAIEVVGLPAAWSENYIRIFFETTYKSGGDTIEFFHAFPDKVVLTFQSNDVALRVCEKHEKQPIEVEQTRLSITQLRNTHRPQVFSSGTILQPNTLLLQNLPEVADERDVRSFLQLVNKCVVQEVWFGLEQGKAIVFFRNMPDYQQFYQHCCLKPLLGQMIGVQCVEKPKSVEVYNVSQLTVHKLETYFEHKISGGDRILNMELKEKDDCAIITFEERRVAENVVAIKSHSFEKIKLTVGLHYECIGIIPPNHDRSTPRGSMPDDVVIGDLLEEVIHFIANTSHCDFITTRLADQHGAVAWDDPNRQPGTLTVTCSMPLAMTSARVKDTWSAEVEATVREVFGLYAHGSVNMLQEGWGEFRKQIGSGQQVDDSLAVTVKRDACSISVVGKRTAVSNKMAELEKIKEEVEQEMTRRKETIAEQMTDIKPHKINFLAESDFPQELKVSYPGASVEMTNNKIVIKGLPSEVKDIKIQIYEVLRRIESAELTPSTEFILLVREKKVRDYVITEFRERSILAAFEVGGNNTVTVSAFTSNDLKSGTAILKSCIVEIRRDISSGAEKDVDTANFQKCIDTLRIQYKGEMVFQLTGDKRSFKLTCIRQISDVIIQSIEKYLELNTIIEKVVHMESGKAAFIAREKTGVLKNIEETQNVMIEPAKSGFTVKGTETSLAASVPRVEMLAFGVVDGNHTINKVGMAKHFSSKNGRDCLKLLEYNNKVVIEICDQPSRNVSYPSTNGKMKCKVAFSTGVTIYVAQGDLTDYRVDVIVNATNPKLQHKQGLAMAIVDKGGRSIQDECDRHISTYGEKSIGKCFTTGSGKLPCKTIIHAVIPQWGSGGDAVAKDLHEAVFAALDDANRLNLETVGIPAIGSGVCGFPANIACRTIIEAINDYCTINESQCINEIHLIDTNRDIVNLFHRHLCDCHGAQSVIDLEPSAVPLAAASSPTANTTGATASTPRHDFTASVVLPTAPLSGWQKGHTYKSIKTKAGVVVSLVRGEIAKEKVDVIVNTTAADLNLSVGGVSASISKAAGPSLQQEANKTYPKGIPKGQIVTTSGGDIKCQKIYHGSLLKWDQSNGEQILRDLVALCLNTAHSSGKTSIAFPALGTGQLSHPRDLVAVAMFDEVRQFSLSNPQTTLRDVRFSVFDAPTITQFQKELDSILTTVKHSTAPKKPRIFKGESAKSVSKKSSKSTGATASAPLSRGVAGACAAALNIKDRVRLEVVHGDITEETTDAIVNSTDDKLGMGSQVSKAIIMKGGSSIADECRRIGRTDKHGIAVTSAGRLGIKHIIHVATPEGLDCTLPWSKPWAKEIEAILKQADSLDCESISLPALGTGNLELAEKDIASALIDAIVDYCKKKVTTLKVVRIVVFQRDMVSIFQTQLEDKARNHSKGYLKMMADYLWGDDDASAEPEVSYEEDDKIVLPVDTSNMSFKMYGASKHHIDETIRLIDDTCSKESKEESIDAPEEQRLIRELTSEQVDRLPILEKRFDVKIELSCGDSIIKVTGLVEDRARAMTQIRKLLHEVDSNKDFEQHAVVLFKLVQWVFEDESVYVDYPVSTSATIERAYLQKKDYIELREEDPDTNHLVKTKINFRTMQECVNGDSTKLKKVKRMIIELPSHWDNMATDDVYKLVPLMAGSPEYTQVELQFTNTVKLGRDTFHAIIAINRIQNQEQFRSFVQKKISMDRANPVGTVNERQLWHGTTADVLAAIYATGFNRIYTGKNGALYGQGVYFAKNASYSVRYSDPDHGGHRHMFLSKVLTGEYTQGKPEHKVPPPKDAERTYDSVVNNMANPEIYVVFKDNHTYPEYVVQFN